MKKVLLAIAFLGMPAFSAAQDQALTGDLTLGQALQEAKDHSPFYRKAQAMEREKGWGQLEAISDGFLPHVHVKGQYFLPDPQYSSLNVAFGPSTFNFPGIFPEKTLALDADFDLFDGFRNFHKLDAANNSHEAARIQADFALLQLEEQVRLEFYKAQAAQLLSDAADQKVKTLQDHLRIVQDQLDNGQATRYDLLQVKVELTSAISEQISAHDDRALAREDLTQTMGLKGDERHLAGELPPLDGDKMLQVTSGLDSKDSPGLKTKQFQFLAQQAQSSAAQSFWFPRVSIIGEYQWYDSPDYLGGQLSADNNFRNSYFLGAAASWDLFDGGLSVAKANEEEERARQAKEEYEAALLQTPNDFDRWKRALVSSLAVYKSRLEGVETAKENARLATLGFKAGTRTTNDVLKAEQDEYQASADLVRSQLGALEALIQLEFLTGKRLIHD